MLPPRGPKGPILSEFVDKRFSVQLYCLLRAKPKREIDGDGIDIRASPLASPPIFTTASSFRLVLLPQSGGGLGSRSRYVA
jgi:hypothetical protein